jgi:hypothetical protein
MEMIRAMKTIGAVARRKSHPTTVRSSFAFVRQRVAELFVELPDSLSLTT